MPYRPKDIVAALKKLGFVELHQTGSHLHLKSGQGRRTVIPMHNRDIPIGTFRAILKQVGLTEAELKPYL